jgi:hypothetical protein
MSVGIQMKLRGMKLAAAAHPESLKAAQWLAEIIAMQEGVITIEAVYRHISPAALQNAAASVFIGEQWQFMGAVPAKRDSRRGGYIGKWALRKNDAKI